MKFRERDGVCVTYQVRGIPGSEQFPYVDDIPSLKEAVTIARTYPGVYGDGAATHVLRSFAKKYPDGHKFHHWSGLTHRWRVDQAGQLQLIVAYSRFEQPSLRRCPQEYAVGLALMPIRATTLQGELVDLALVAKSIGLHKAAAALTDHVYGRNSLPNFSVEAAPAAACSADVVPSSRPFLQRVRKWLEPQERDGQSED